tara:strand:- start:700 stop:1704 length:1005 start_codon:yes stop_codon:yes gene_type:complete
MKIDIKSTYPIESYYLKNLRNERLDFKLGEEFALDHGWYELHIPYSGTKNNFQDIMLNDVSLDELIYTGYYTDGQSKIHQPATAVWDSGGWFSIWLHSDIGVFMERTTRCLRGGDFGTNLFDKYSLIVDRPHDIDPSYPIEIRSFFGTGDGPYWWRNDSESLPYKKIASPDLDKDLILKECDTLCTYEKTISPKEKEGQEYTIKSTHPDCIFDLPFANFDPIKFPNLKQLFDFIGMKRPMSIGVNTLNPGKHFHIHRDSGNYSRKGFDYVKGCRIFYWLLTDPKDIYFKFGRCGLLPLDTPLFINSIEHVHSVVNQSKKPRLVISVAGEFYNDK